MITASGVIDAITSKTGLVAAVVVLVGLALAFQNLLRPWWTDRRAAEASRPRLVLTGFELGGLKAYAASRELRFTVNNSGKGTAVLTSLRLVVLEHGPSEQARQTKVAAPVEVYEHRVELKPDKDRYDIRAKKFGPAAAPLRYTEGGVDAFVVTVVARDPQWYRIKVQGDWYDVAHPETPQLFESTEVVADYPPSTL